MRKIGILGGTFNPVHLAHLFIAENARAAFELDKVWFIPNYMPPHKSEKLAFPQDRLKMVELAISGNPAFEICRLEIEKPEPSYTIDTVRELKKQQPEAKFYFIAGADALSKYRWRKLDELLGELEGFIVVNRSKAGFGDFKRWLSGAGLRNAGKFSLLKLPLLEISSTLLRQWIKQGLPVKYLIPEKVENYLAEKISTKVKKASDSALELAEKIYRILEEKKGEDILVLDTRELTPLFSYAVLVTANSTVHSQALAENLAAALKKDKIFCLNQVRGVSASWILLDFGVVIVHVFLADTRDYYDIEGLWKSAPRMILE